MSFYFYDPLWISHILLNLWTLNLLGSISLLHQFWGKKLLTRACCSEMNFPWPQKWMCLCKNTRFLLLKEMLIQTLSQGRIPCFPHEMLPRNAAALRIYVSSPEPQSLMHILASVLPIPPDVSPVFKIPNLPESLPGFFFWQSVWTL